MLVKRLALRATWPLHMLFPLLNSLSFLFHLVNSHPSFLLPCHHFLSTEGWGSERLLCTLITHSAPSQNESSLKASMDRHYSPWDSCTQEWKRVYSVHMKTEKEG